MKRRKTEKLSAGHRRLRKFLGRLIDGSAGLRELADVSDVARITTPAGVDALCRQIETCSQTDRPSDFLIRWLGFVPKADKALDSSVSSGRAEAPVNPQTVH